MRLEDDGYLLVLVQLADGLHALGYFGRVVGVIAEEYNPVVLQLEVETAVHSAETCHSLFDFLVGHSVQMCERHGSYAVLYVDADRYAEPDVIDACIRSHEVDEDFAVSDADILCMEIAFIAGVGVYPYTRLHVGLQGKAFTDNQCASRLDEGSVVAETFQIGFACTIYVQVVGIGGCDDTHIGRKPVE